MTRFRQILNELADPTGERRELLRLRAQVRELSEPRCDWDCDSCHEGCVDEQVRCGTGCHYREQN